MTLALATTLLVVAGQMVARSKQASKLTVALPLHYTGSSSVITRKWNYRVRFLLPELLLFGLLVLLPMFLHESYGQQRGSQQNDDEDEKEEVENASKAETTTKKPEKKDCTFVCPENRGNYADPCTCRRFYICSTDGAAHRSFCPNGLYWDDEKK